MRRDVRGFGAMELALALPVLMLLCLGMIDIWNLVAKKLDYEAAAQVTTDMAQARRPNGTGTAYLVTIARANSGAAADEVTVEAFLECDGTKMTNFTDSCTAGQTTARFVSVEILRVETTYFDWAALGRLLGIKTFSNNVPVRGDSLVRLQ